MAAQQVNVAGVFCFRKLQTHVSVKVAVLRGEFFTATDSISVGTMPYPEMNELEGFVLYH